MSSRRFLRPGVACLAAAVLHVGAGPLSAQDAERGAAADASGATVELPRSDPPEITAPAKNAIQRGLQFLANSQNHDGSWRTNGATGGYPVAMTSLAGLALLASGNTPTEGPYARNVSGALTFVLRSARRDGLIAQLEEESHCMHGHGFALLFLAQCYGMAESPQRQAEIRLALQRAVDLTARSQSAAGGWLYTPDSRGDEGSVTVTQVQGLRAARNAGIAVPKRVIDRAMQYLEHSRNPDGGIRYMVSDGGMSRPPISAAAVVCYFNAGVYDTDEVRKTLVYLRGHLSARNLHARVDFGHFFYAHLYMAQAMYLVGEQDWRDYFPAMRDFLVQRQDGRNGAWQGDQVGEVYGTAVALLILQLPYKNLPIMQR